MFWFFWFLCGPFFPFLHLRCYLFYSDNWIWWGKRKSVYCALSSLQLPSLLSSFLLSSPLIFFTLRPLLSSLLFSSGWGDGESRNKTSPIIIKPSFLSEHYRFHCCLYLGDVTHSDSSCAAVIATTAISAGILVNRQKWIQINSCNDSSLINGSLPSFNSSIPISAISPSLPVVSLPLSLFLCNLSFLSLSTIIQNVRIIVTTPFHKHALSLNLSPSLTLCSLLISLSICRSILISLLLFSLLFSFLF